MNFKVFLTKYLSQTFLFDINRIQIERIDKVFGLIGAVLVILAIVFKLASIYAPTPSDNKFRGKFYALFFSIGLSEIIWFLCRWQTVTFFGSHFVALFFLLVGVIWFLILVVKMIKGYSKEKADWEKEQVKLKYLPK